MEPIDRDRVLDAIEDAIDDGAVEDALELCDGLLMRDPEDPDALALKGDVLADCGEFRGALAHYERAHELVADWEDGELRRASMLLEMGYLDEAQDLLDVALGRNPERADLHLTQGLVFELAGNELGAERHFRKARAHDPLLNAPIRVTEEHFMEMARLSWERFPADIKANFDNLDIFVRDLPDPEACREAETPLSMLVLGYFDGPMRNMRSTEDPFSHMPSTVFLFKKNHERICANLAELEAQIDITLKHELGHFLGLEEHDMERLGLE